MKKNVHQVSSSEKDKDGKAWYKEQADLVDGYRKKNMLTHNEVDTHRNMKVNYDLFNNILNLKDFEYVCKPFGEGAGELPAKMVNRDIVSGKIKKILGAESKKPFVWNVIATNPEATTRKETEKYNRIKQYVSSEIMKPIRIRIEQQKAEENKGKKLTPDELQKVQQEIEEELKAQTPEEVNKYMAREHQDPSEVMSQQLLQYLIQKCDLKRKFNVALKHGLLSAVQCMFIGEVNGEPETWNVNSMRLDFDNSDDLEFIQQGEYASYEYRFTPSQIISYFGKDLKDAEISDIYAQYKSNRTLDTENEDFFNRLDKTDNYNTTNGISVIHCTWKAPRKIGFLTYLDQATGKKEELLVDENYKLNIDAGDIDIEWEWIPEAYETWKIKANKSIYARMRPIPGQFKDLDNLYHCNLPYYGIVYDNMNSKRTSLMDRLKFYQYFYNIVMYRLELLLASDDGKKVLMNINMIPDSAGIDIKKWQYFAKSTPYMWYDPNEEGTGYNDVNTVAKVLDLSLISDIQKYMEIAEYLRVQCGKSVGITDAVEGQTSPNQTNGNLNQNLEQSSDILEPYYELHNYFKRDVLQALLETAKVAYSNSKKQKLCYFLDDMSKAIIDMDINLLDNSTLGIFISNSSKAQEVKDMIGQLTHAAMQNQKVELSDVIAVIRQESIIEAEETLKLAEDRRNKQEQQANDNNNKAKSDSEEKQREFLRETWKHEADMIVLKEEEKRETEIQKAAIMGASFNPDQDKDNDGINDFIEIAKHGLNVDIKQQNVQLQRDKFEYDKIKNNKQLEQQDKKLSIEQKKLNNNK